jgi:putative oxidoreductase
MSTLERFLPFIGRVLLALIFVQSGINKIGGFEGTVGYIASNGLPMPQVIAALTIALEVGAGVALILGWKARLAAFALALFSIAAAVLFHDFWHMAGPQKGQQMIQFMKNLSIAGGLLYVVAFGAGGLSLDRRR